MRRLLLRNIWFNDKLHFNGIWMDDYKYVSECDTEDELRGKPGLRS